MLFLAEFGCSRQNSQLTFGLTIRGGGWGMGDRGVGEGVEGHEGHEVLRFPHWNRYVCLAHVLPGRKAAASQCQTKAT